MQQVVYLANKFSGFPINLKETFINFYSFKFLNFLLLKMHIHNLYYSFKQQMPLADVLYNYKFYLFCTFNRLIQHHHHHQNHNPLFSSYITFNIDPVYMKLTIFNTHLPPSVLLFKKYNFNWTHARAKALNDSGTLRHKNFFFKKWPCAYV